MVGSHDRLIGEVDHEDLRLVLYHLSQLSGVPPSVPTVADLLRPLSQPALDRLRQGLVRFGPDRGKDGSSAGANAATTPTFRRAARSVRG